MACVKECGCANTTCKNFGKCCACVKQHAEKGNLPFCLRPPVGEKA
ncbi:MAG: hypothetical protein FWD82_08745 [Defluviitaleaceae bacterium]|nr:hypothetical protein [Defluviitaleaceae bacterium]